MEIKFDKKSLAVVQNSYVTKIVNSYFVYDLDIWRNNPLTNLRLKNYLFGGTSILKYKAIIFGIIVHHIMPIIARIVF